MTKGDTVVQCHQSPHNFPLNFVKIHTLIYCNRLVDGPINTPWYLNSPVK